jgi:hypothetical protein
LNKVARTGIAAVCLWTLCASAPARAVERVAALHSDIRIAAGGELAVTETIELQSGRAAPRGIVREFYTHHRDRAGNRVRVPLTVERVLRNGRPEPYALERLPQGMRVRTGEAGGALPRGKHVYEITYRTARQVGFFDQHDELYWNVGGGWPFAFERLSAEVSFERAVPAEAMKLGAYTGAPDARGEDYHAFVREGSAAFRATRPLAAREGMAIVVAFPKGFVAQPQALESGAWYLEANPGVPAGAAVLAAMLAFLFAVRARCMPKSTPGAALPAPPEGVGPAGVRFIYRNRYDERCLRAALLGLQARGYLRIREHGERLHVERTGMPLEWLPGEEALARRLLRGEGHAVIRRQGRALDEAGRRLSRDLRQAFPRRAWTGQGSFLLAAAGIGAAGVLAMIALETPHLPLMVIAAAIAASLVTFAAWVLPVFESPRRRHRLQIEALREYLAAGEPQADEERARLAPYAVALGIDWTKALDLTVPAPDKAPARPTRPLRHIRSAAA